MTNLHCHSYIPGSFDMPDQVKYIVYKVITAACNSPELGWPYESKAKFKINMLMKIEELTGQTIPVIMRISLLIRTIQPF